MAATDQFYRKQRTLDVVFGVSSVLMLVSLILMFYQDQKKEWKDDQRLGYDVEEAMAQRAVIAALPERARIEATEKAVLEAQDALKARKSEIDALEADLRGLLAKKVRAENDFQETKAAYDSLMSLIAIETEHRNQAEEGRRAVHDASLNKLTARLKELKEGLDQRLREFEKAEKEYNDTKKKLDDIKRPVTDAVAELKKLYIEFDRVAKLAEQKHWKWYNQGFRDIPVIDAFNAPVRIHQFVLEDLPIEYGSFKYVARYDRCMSCHLAIDRPAYTKEALRALKDAPDDLKKKLEDARATITRRRDLLADKKEKALLDFDPGSLRTVPLTEKQVNEFCAHPRMDLFVDDNSPHPKEKFGCSICHSGQGSATAFNLASHTPDDAKTMDRWRKDYHWESNHYWDFPMLPKRFIESTCVKCHHQITDLIRDGSKNEAPKLVRGFNLVKDNGCFGCHEIGGMKGGRVIGPDLRLEPSPPLEAMSASERVKATSDPLNPVGTMRKVGPSLRRLADKTNDEWVRKWIRDPRGFRPDTKMPHFYGLSNTLPENLPEAQKGFPDAEIHAVSHYLMNASREYLQGKDSYRLQLDARIKLLDAKTNRTDAETKELFDARRKLELYPLPATLDDKTITLDGGSTVPLPPEGKDAETRGRVLFSERGCLACHSHKGTETAGTAPAIMGDAQFGPKLGQIAAKLGQKAGDKASARRWLVQWILNPNQHHPRTFMPITHLTVDQASDIATWLLNQKATWTAEDVPAPKMDALKGLARVWLEKSRTQVEIDDLLGEKNPDWVKEIRDDSDERFLKAGLTESNLKMYVGKKAVGNAGCYACHDVPGFENAKPIGTALNDWGKKDAERLAFEDIGAYLKKHYQVVKSLGDDKDVHDHALHYDQGKAPYEQFYHNEIAHHSRIGFLNQKLLEPRSYDHDRIRKWDERLRMPQYKFGRVDRKAKETDEEYRNRSNLAEAEAREAVMTFILGLVAEPIPAKFIHHPAPDRKAEVVGRQVLDKYNCAGCHLVRGGVYEFKKTKDGLDYLDQEATRAATALKSEYHFPGYNAFSGRPQSSGDRWTVRATPLTSQPIDDAIILRLTEALRFTGADGATKDLPASANVIVKKTKKEDEPVDDRAGIYVADQLNPEAGPYGGIFASLLVPYLKAKDKQLFGDDTNALAAAPPPLLRQGEKTQPDWLFRFLRNPHEIRPQTVLRMPKFNMSDDEAMALVNYFAASDKISNPGEGLAYPYATVRQRDDDYWQAMSREYIERAKASLPALKEKHIPAAEAAVKAAKEKKDAKEALENAQKELDYLVQKNERAAKLAKLDGEEARNAYAADTYRLLVNYNTPCLNCHRVGSAPPKQNQGPPLEIGWERLRPQWTEKWFANPNRLISYPTPMPANFNKPNVDAQGHGKDWPEFLGTPMDQATAVRDLLMNYPKLSELPVNRGHKPPQPPGTGGGK